MIRRPPISTRTDTLCPYTTLFRSLSKRVLSLSMARDQKAASTVVSTLRTYRTYSRMVCADEVAAIESRLLGEKTGEVTKRDRQRMEKQAATDRKSTRLNSSH